MRGCYDTEIDLYFFKVVKSYSLERLRLSFLISLYSDGYFGLYPSVDSANVYVHYGIISSQLFFFDDRPIGAGKKGNCINRFREEVKRRD